jgi:hypothetical protein
MAHRNDGFGTKRDENESSLAEVMKPKPGDSNPPKNDGGIGFGHAA